MSDARAEPAAPTAPERASADRRIPGIDLARALAILGMLAVHVGPTDAGVLGGTLYGLTHGRAAILFGLLAGVGVSLLAASRSTSAAAARAKLLWRAAVLLPLGLWLQTLDHGVYVILQDYALLFVVATVVLSVPDRWLLGLAAATTVLGSTGYLWGLIHDPVAFERRAAALGDAAGEIVHRLVLSGPYPLITWTGPFLLGMWIGRRDLRRGSAPRRLVVGGGLAAVGAWGLSWLLVAWRGAPGEVAGWDHLLLDDPHSQMPLWLIGSTGSAVLVLGASLWLADRATFATWPLVAAGQLAFTVYVGHLLALHWDRDRLTSDEVGLAALIVLGFALAAMALATAWRAVLPRGPLELVLHLPWVIAGRSRRPARTSRDPLAYHRHRSKADDERH
jgi:uncharacterized membrane protein